ncbi:DNA repair protein RecN [Pseudarthrobacter sp. AL07]|uniref:DNA repair protein RecN n=1 Tax=unclassified Pseudarthrobacter TaxID=2647000 RepID=UPI002499DC44|nr:MULTISPECIES: DNA repair protein RecN [unclassified Pseudarthrobacter]MDI3194888.1 DNA repair protein RecN [Pseudarthrobacter sp. AL20]MDI3208865.1 DNA repair protein RecN [Pseudarthrobacter sp. AL07]
MLEELRIRDLGVITDATLPLGPGLSVVTGETGAGKTMVVTAVGLLLGARSDAGAVRSGAKSATAEAVLKLDAGHPAIARAVEAGADVEEFDGGTELILARRLGADGRSRAFLGGRAAPVGVLAEIGETLVVVHGQSDQIRLKGAAAQRGALDKFAGDALAGPMTSYQSLYSHWKASQAELETLRSAARDRLREAESLEVALAEISTVDPQPGEDESLKAEAVKLANVEELRIAANTAHQALIAEDYGDSGDATTLVDVAKRTLEHVAEHDAELGSAATRLAEVGFLLNDIATELASYQAGLDSEGPERLAEIEDRRSALATLVRKYAPSIDEVLVWAENARVRFDELQDDSTRIEALDADVVRTEAELQKQAAAVSKIRAKAARELSARVSAELKALAMADATLVITREAAGQLTQHGADEITFLLQPHSGAPARPLGKGASGGELSRVMLAIEVVLAAVDPVPTFVFDEVDAGVGGRAAVEIGRRLAMLAQHVQVLVVTHLPQVAAFADQHITVTKTSVRGADGGTATGFTSSDVRLLDGPERVRELARMLAGQEDSESAQAHAQELLDDAKLLPQRA